MGLRPNGLLAELTLVRAKLLVKLDVRRIYHDLVLGGWSLGARNADA